MCNYCRTVVLDYTYEDIIYVKNLFPASIEYLNIYLLHYESINFLWDIGLLIWGQGFNDYEKGFNIC